MLFVSFMKHSTPWTKQRTYACLHVPPLVLMIKWMWATCGACLSVARWPATRSSRLRLLPLSCPRLVAWHLLCPAAATCAGRRPVFATSAVYLYVWRTPWC